MKEDMVMKRSIALAITAVWLLNGQPAWAQKDEVENGKLQLSVYTKEGSGFSEVIVDHTTGKVAKTEAITSGDDLTAAKAQSEAMVKGHEFKTVSEKLD